MHCTECKYCCNIIIYHYLHDISLITIHKSYCVRLKKYVNNYNDSPARYCIHYTSRVK